MLFLVLIQRNQLPTLECHVLVSLGKKWKKASWNRRTERCPCLRYFVAGLNMVERLKPGKRTSWRGNLSVDSTSTVFVGVWVHTFSLRSCLGKINGLATGTGTYFTFGPKGDNSFSWSSNVLLAIEMNHTFQSHHQFSSCQSCCCRSIYWSQIRWIRHLRRRAFHSYAGILQTLANDKGLPKHDTCNKVPKHWEPIGDSQISVLV